MPALRRSRRSTSRWHWRPDPFAAAAELGEAARPALAAFGMKPADPAWLVTELLDAEIEEELSP